MIVPRYRIFYKPSADRELQRLPVDVQRRIVKAVHRLADNPRPAGCIKLKGSERTWRIRIGDYRVIYEIYDDRLVVYVIEVVDRKDAYGR
jgi:mRNA interferase RelE/StbE